MSIEIQNADIYRHDLEIECRNVRIDPQNIEIEFQSVDLLIGIELN